MMIDLDLVAMAIVAAVLILPGVGISAYHHMRAKRIAFSPSATAQSCGSASGRRSETSQAGVGAKRPPPVKEIGGSGPWWNGAPAGGRVSLSEAPESHTCRAASARNHMHPPRRCKPPSENSPGRRRSAPAGLGGTQGPPGCAAVQGATTGPIPGGRGNRKAGGRRRRA